MTLRCRNPRAYSSKEKAPTCHRGMEGSSCRVNDNGSLSNGCAPASRNSVSTVVLKPVSGGLSGKTGGGLLPLFAKTCHLLSWSLASNDWLGNNHPDMK